MLGIGIQSRDGIMIRIRSVMYPPVWKNSWQISCMMSDIVHVHQSLGQNLAKFHKKTKGGVHLAFYQK